MAGLRRDGGSMPPDIGLPCKLGRPQPGRIPGAGGGFPAPGRLRPHICIPPGTVAAYSLKWDGPG